jgi:hypothetical protein
MVAASWQKESVSVHGFNARNLLGEISPAMAAVAAPAGRGKPFAAAGDIESLWLFKKQQICGKVSSKRP